MPIKLDLPGGRTIYRVHGEWQVEGFEDTTPSLILAYSACFAGGIQLGEMAEALRRDDLSITDLADEEVDHLLSFLYAKVEETYTHLDAVGEESNSRDRIARVLISLEKMRRDLCGNPERLDYPVITQLLEQAIIRFANLLARKQLQCTSEIT